MAKMRYTEGRALHVLAVATSLTTKLALSQNRYGNLKPYVDVVDGIRKEEPSSYYIDASGAPPRGTRGPAEALDLFRWVCSRAAVELTKMLTASQYRASPQFARGRSRSKALPVGSSPRSDTRRTKIQRCQAPWATSRAPIIARYPHAGFEPWWPGESVAKAYQPSPSLRAQLQDILSAEVVRNNPNILKTQALAGAAKRAALMGKQRREKVGRRCGEGLRVALPVSAESSFAGVFTQGFLEVPKPCRRQGRF
eukprot:scaffold7483_cov286-Pinguiococcus_pyrenoidosus.AAC.4